MRAPVPFFPFFPSLFTIFFPPRTRRFCRIVGSASLPSFFPPSFPSPFPLSLDWANSGRRHRPPVFIVVLPFPPPPPPQALDRQKMSVSGSNQRPFSIFLLKLRNVVISRRGRDSMENAGPLLSLLFHRSFLFPKYQNRPVWTKKDYWRSPRPALLSFCLSLPSSCRSGRFCRSISRLFFFSCTFLLPPPCRPYRSCPPAKSLIEGINPLFPLLSLPFPSSFSSAFADERGNSARDWLSPPLPHFSPVREVKSTESIAFPPSFPRLFSPRASSHLVTKAGSKAGKGGTISFLFS